MSTYETSIEAVGNGDVVCKISNGAFCGMVLPHEPIVSEQPFDEWAAERITEARQSISSAQGWIERLELLRGKVTFPSREEFQKASRIAAREYEEKPWRDAEALLERMVKEGVDSEKIVYAKIKASALKKELDRNDDRINVPAERQIPEFDATDEGLPAMRDSGGVPVRAMVSNIGAGSAVGNFVVQLEVTQPINVELPPQLVSRQELAALCRAVEITSTTDLEDLMFRPFTALMNEIGQVTRYFYPDRDDAPSIPSINAQPRRPWSSWQHA